jgi:hypothetical protein
MNFYSCSILNDPHHSPSTLKCSNLFPPQDETTIATLDEEPGPQKQKRNRGIRSLNKMHEEIIKVTAQFPDGSPIEPKGVLSKWCNDCSVLVMENVRSPRLIGALFQ